MLAVKENQGRLYEDVRDLFEGAAEFGFEGVPHDYATTLNKGHGRVERRECWAISDPLSLEYLSTGQDWPNLHSVVKVAGRRATDEGATLQARYYISSLDASASRLLEAIRAHWSIENSLHWSLDVTFREDQCRIRKESRSAEHGDAKAGFPQPAETGNQPQSRHPGQTPASWLEGGLPAESPSQLKRDCPGIPTWGFCAQGLSIVATALSPLITPPSRSAGSELVKGLANTPSA